MSRVIWQGKDEQHANLVRVIEVYPAWLIAEEAIGHDALGMQRWSRIEEPARAAEIVSVAVWFSTVARRPTSQHRRPATEPPEDVHGDHDNGTPPLDEVPF